MSQRTMSVVSFTAPRWSLGNKQSLLKIPNSNKATLQRTSLQTNRRCGAQSAGLSPRQTRSKRCYRRRVPCKSEKVGSRGFTLKFCSFWPKKGEERQSKLNNSSPTFDFDPFFSPSSSYYGQFKFQNL
jgi:hypothetical protein